MSHGQAIENWNNETKQKERRDLKNFYTHNKPISSNVTQKTQKTKHKNIKVNYLSDTNNINTQFKTDNMVHKKNYKI